MITIEKAWEIIDKQQVTKNVISLPTTDACGYVLAENILSTLSMPSFRQSALDGYAILHSDFLTGQKLFLVEDEVPAGCTEKKVLKKGTAMRIFTGAPVPDNATAVVMQEETTREGGNVNILSAGIKEGQNIRPIGDEIEQGDIVLSAGFRINASCMALLQAQGISTVQVYKKPRIAVLVTGSELVKPGESLSFGQIYESNSAALSHALKHFTYPVKQLAMVKDDYTELVQTIKKLLSENDVLLVSGGISVGDYDFTGKALRELQTEELFYKINQKPGKPLYFGRNGEAYVFGLPGNPASALVCLYEYVSRLLQRTEGVCGFPFPVFNLPLKEDLMLKGKRGHFLKAYADKDGVQVLGGQNSHMMQSFAKANALVYMPEGKTEAAAGQCVEVHLIQI